MSSSSLVTVKPGTGIAAAGARRAPFQMVNTDGDHLDGMAPDPS